MESVILDPEQQAVYKIIESSYDNIFVTGKAGSGKSVLLRHFVNNETKKRKVVLAPTGIAAIQVGGQTIHSFFAFDYTALDPKSIWRDEKGNILPETHPYIAQIVPLLRNIDVLIIDEISMVRSDVMECINIKLQIARKNALPFGGVQVVVFGDLYQLPPVVADNDIRRYLDERFGGSFFFNAPAVIDADFKIYELESIHRQKEPEFQSMLNEIRTGTASPDTIDRFNERYDILPPHKKDDVLTIATTNKIVDEVNDYKFRILSAKEFTYMATLSGDTEQLKTQLDTYLRLKAGSQVIMLRNHWQDGKLLWANGTLGVVAELSENVVKVKIRGIVYDVKREKWETRNHIYNSKTNTISNEKAGEFIQFPLCLAWALTIHKSQGQTYDSVAVDFGKGAFLHGQAYVALSRCKSFDELYLIQKLKASDIIIDRNVVRFLSKQRTGIPGAAHMASAPQRKRSGIAVLISCSKQKRAYPCEAGQLYDASDLFKKQLAYAQTIINDIHVISAKYGLIRLDEIVAPYDETLKDMPAEEKAFWGKRTAAQIFERYDLQNTDFVILAGKDYYAPLMAYLPRIKLPLLGLPIGKRLAMLDKLIMCGRMHRLFNGMPRYFWDTVDAIGFDNGIYIVFEKGETYYDMDRIVRVGTHTSDGRLRRRLQDHFVKENKDGSIFRKNIGRAVLNRNKHPYLAVWNIDTSKKDRIASLGEKYDFSFQQKLEKQISNYMCENMSFVCFPVSTEQERLRLEEGIMATLNAASDFMASPNWRGKHSPEYEIAKSGLWLQKGLYGTPLSESEYTAIESHCFSNSYTKKQAPELASTAALKLNINGIRTADVVQYISEKLASAEVTGASSITVISGSIHKELGLVSRMPTVCGAMYKLMKPGDIIHYAPPSGNGATLKIEYFL